MENYFLYSEIRVKMNKDNLQKEFDTPDFILGEKK